MGHFFAGPLVGLELGLRLENPLSSHGSGSSASTGTGFSARAGLSAASDTTAVASACSAAMADMYSSSSCGSKHCNVSSHSSQGMPYEPPNKVRGRSYITRLPTICSALCKYKSTCSVKLQRMVASLPPRPRDSRSARTTAMAFSSGVDSALKASPFW
eukprot:SAG11_NODE_6701_length_1263_cov_1.063574_2_plen_158_part_00